MPLPELQTTDSATPNPVESLPVPSGEAFGAGAYAGLEKSLGTSLETQAIGKLAGGTQFIPFDDAKSIMEQNGYDPNVLPANGLSNTELNAIMNQQSAIKRNEAIVQQSNLSPFMKGTAGFVGGAGDPLFLAAGPVLGRLGFAVKGMGIGGRVAAGAAEGGIVNGGYDVAEKQFGTAPGDHDIGTQQIVQDVLVGGLVGGALHGAFGPRAAPVTQPVDFDSAVSKVFQEEGGTTTDTGGLTKFGISQNAHPGLDIANLSQQQATSIYKSEYWNAIGADKLPPEMRMTAFDAAVNQGVGKTKEMLAAAGGDVAKFNGLREAEYRRLAAADPAKYGHELQGWLNRLQGVEGGSAASARPSAATEPDASPVAQDAASHGLEAQAADSVLSLDSDPGFRTNPFRLADEHADQVTSLETEAMQRAGNRGVIPNANDETIGATNGEAARGVQNDTGNLREVPDQSGTQGSAPVQPVPRAGYAGVAAGSHPIEPGSIFTGDEGAKRILAEPVKRTPAPAPGAPNPEAADLQRHAADAVTEAEHAHSLTSGAKAEEPGEETPLHADLADSEEALHNAGYSQDMVKAIHTAVRCGVVKGLA